MPRLNKNNTAAPLENDPEPVTPSGATATLPAKRKRGRPAKNPQPLHAGSRATESKASGAATILSVPIPRKRGRPPKAPRRTSSVPVSPKTIPGGPQPGLGLPADTATVSTAVAADTQPLTSPPSQKEIPRPAASAEEVKEVLVAVKHLVGYQHLPDEEFMDHLKRTKPNLLEDLLLIKHQLQTTFHNQSDSANGPRTERDPAAAQVTTAPDIQPAVSASKEAATRSEQSPVDAETKSSGENKKAEPAT
ncbi:MAG: hypothetical protein Q9206_005606 [Seirophora lacunosa]